MNELKKNIAPLEKRSRYLGCLLGGAVGDALGYPIEFWSEDRIFQRCGPQGIQTLEQIGAVARISDDTQMTLFAANALLYAASTGETALYSLKTAYLEWLSTQGDIFANVIRKPAMWIYGDKRLHAARAPGVTCCRALRQLTADRSRSHADNNSKGCGTVMRAAPFGLAVPGKPGLQDGEGREKAAGLAVMDAVLTHGHPAAAASSAALAGIVFEILRDSPEDRTLQAVIARVQTGEPEVDDLVKKAVLLAEDPAVSDLEGVHILGKGWIAEEALAIAVFCAVRHQNDFAKAIRAAVNHEGDSDSTGAVCGNILGAWLGKEAVEAAFDLTHLELADCITAVAEDLFRFAETGVPEPGADPDWDEKYRTT